METIIEEKKEKKEIGYRDILKQKEYMKIIIANLINRFGDSVDSIAMTWLVYQLTQSAAWSAIIYGVNRIPTIFLQPLAGAIVEKRKKKTIMIWMDIVRGCCVGLIASCFVIGIINEWIILICTIIISSAEAFRTPAATAFIPKLITPEFYSYGNSLNTSASTLMELVGVGTGGIIIAIGGISTAIYIDMITFFTSAFIIAMIKCKENIHKNETEKTRCFANLKEGFQYVIHKKTLVYFVMFGVLINAFVSPLESLMAPITSELLHSEEIMLTVINVSIMIGTLIGAAVFPYMTKKVKKSTILRVGCSMIGLYISSFYFASNIKQIKLLYVVIALASFIAGFMIAQINTLLGVEVMTQCDPDYLARVGGILSAGTTASMPVTSFLIGAVTKMVPIGMILLISSGVILIITAIICAPSLMRNLHLNE